MSDLIARLSVLEAEQEERAWCVTAETKDQAWRNAESALTEAFSLARQAVAEKDEYKCCANGITLEAATSSESFTDELA